MDTRKLIRLLAALVLLGLGLPDIVWTADSAAKQETDSLSSPSATSSMKGQVLKIEPEALVLATDGGGQVRLKINKDTQMDRALKAGDKVEAEVGADHQLMVVKPSK